MRRRGQHFPDVQARHDGLASACVVGQQEPELGLLQHVMVDGDSLMGKRIDQGSFRGESRIEEMAVGQPVCFGDGGDRSRVG